ncbi:ATP-binding protein [Ramlibacter tataouinensis]|uniref:ATP-binding protein n=1 Tax=Ramlibacter tataouinensis TaxID=94132 RepID=UPI0022F3C464|nr:ATP-binding protein [Ramlibacter tataouinensis]WBY01718.1 ATP-binding protein [Ramlibacter tataouinensis]
MKPVRARSVRSKLNLALAATTLIALVLAGLALLVVDLQSELEDMREDLMTHADVIALVSAPALSFADPAVAAENLAVLRVKRGVTAAALYDDRGRLFASYRRDGGETIPPRPEPVGGAADSVRVNGDWAVVWRPVFSSEDRVGTIWLQLRHDRWRQTLEYLGVLALVMGCSLAAALLLSHRLQRTLTAPVLGVSEVARKILRGETGNLRAIRTSDDEVGDLIDAFNAMLDELGRRARAQEDANRALRASEARYQLAVRGSSAGLWDWDIAAGTMFYSPRFKALLGYSDEDFPDRPDSAGKVLHPDDLPVMQAALRGHLRERQPFQVECRLRDRDGRWRWFLVAGAALWDAAGQPYRMAGSVIEVTERKQAEQVLHEANRAKDEFIATLAHELRNPLAPIRTGLEILKKDKANGPLSERARATMERQLSHMIRLIDDLLDISRINRGKIRLDISRLRLRPVIDGAVEIGRPAVQAGRHELHVDYPGADIELMGDPTRLAQALGNLLNNAAKYTPPGGRIDLRVRREGDSALIEVEDTGEGIPADMLESIFCLFAQVRGSMDRAQGGLGIGLYLVRSLVALHGGSVVASSAGPARGSRFTVRLPCLPATAQPLPAAPAIQADARTSGLKVLLVDDNVDAAETLSLVLGMAGCETRMLHEGTGVLAAARAFGPDAVLLDIGLPGLNGYEVAAQLRSEPRFARTLLVAITGWGTDQDRRRSQEAGFDHHLTKPVDMADLEPLLQALAAGGDGSDCG